MKLVETLRLPEVWDPSDDRLWEEMEKHRRLYARLKRELKSMAKLWARGRMVDEETFQEVAATVWMLASYYRWSVTLNLEDEETAGEWWVVMVKLVRRDGRFAFEAVEFPRW